MAKAIYKTKNREGMTKGQRISCADLHVNDCVQFQYYGVTTMWIVTDIKTYGVVFRSSESIFLPFSTEKIIYYLGTKLTLWERFYAFCKRQLLRS